MHHPYGASYGKNRDVRQFGIGNEDYDPFAHDSDQKNNRSVSKPRAMVNNILNDDARQDFNHDLNYNNRNHTRCIFLKERFYKKIARDHDALRSNRDSFRDTNRSTLGGGMNQSAGERSARKQRSPYRQA